MKYLYKNNDIPKDVFITKYEVIGDSIIVTYADGNTIKFDYSINQINLIESSMKNQIEKAENKIREYASDNSKEIFWEIYTAWFMYYTAHNYMTTDIERSKIIQGSCFLSFVAMFLIRGYSYFSRKELINEYLKYKYFIENEDILNYENNLRNSENNINPNEIYRLSINDLDNMSIKELEEMVELITNTYGDKVLKRQ